MEPLANDRPGKGGDRHGFRSWIHALLWQPLLELRTRPEAGWIPDLVAGLTVASLAIPQSIAYASIADLPPHYGLNSAVVAALVGALWPDPWSTARRSAGCYGPPGPRPR